MGGRGGAREAEGVRADEWVGGVEPGEARLGRARQIRGMGARRVEGQEIVLQGCAKVVGGGVNLCAGAIMVEVWGGGDVITTRINCCSNADLGQG